MDFLGHLGELRVLRQTNDLIRFFWIEMAAIAKAESDRIRIAPDLMGQGGVNDSDAPTGVDIGPVDRAA
jgi:hypothetical protein